MLQHRPGIGLTQGFEGLVGRAGRFIAVHQVKALPLQAQRQMLLRIDSQTASCRSHRTRQVVGVAQRMRQVQPIQAIPRRCARGASKSQCGCLPLTTGRAGQAKIPVLLLGSERRRGRRNERLVVAGRRAAGHGAVLFRCEGCAAARREGVPADHDDPPGRDAMPRIGTRGPATSRPWARISCSRA